MRLSVAHHHALLYASHHSVLGPIKPPPPASFFFLRINIILFNDPLQVLLSHYISISLAGPLILLELVLVKRYLVDIRLDEVHLPFLFLGQLRFVLR